jgi:hypothetical protein
MGDREGGAASRTGPREGDEASTMVDLEGGAADSVSANDAPSLTDDSTDSRDSWRDDGAPSTADATAASCSSYCAAITSTCTGPNAQYHDLQRCLSACPLMATGTTSDTTGDTLGCRMFHLGLAAGAPNPECWRAGPFGYGGCGGECDDFCALAVAWCSPSHGYPGPLPYASLSDCLTTCASYTQVDTAGGVGVDGGWFAWGPFGGNTLDCRETHLGNALDDQQGGQQQAMHCQHVQKTPPGGQCLQ